MTIGNLHLSSLACLTCFLMFSVLPPHISACFPENSSLHSFVHVTSLCWGQLSTSFLDLEMSYDRSKRWVSCLHRSALVSVYFSDIKRMRLINYRNIIVFPGCFLTWCLGEKMLRIQCDRLFGSTGQLIRADDMASYRKEQ